MISVTILSHRKDADGIASAALLKILKPKATVLLADYSDLVETLADAIVTDELYISDLALNESTFRGFAVQVARFASSGSKIFYIEHHPLKEGFKNELEESGVEIYHDKQESAAILVYRKFEDYLKEFTHAKILATNGAITDLMDDGPLAKKLISSFDRQFLLYEATVLAFTISIIRKDHGRNLRNCSDNLVSLVENLATGRLPHELPRAIEYSQEFAENATLLLKELRRTGKKVGNMAYTKTEESSTGNVAYALIGAFNVSVGMAFREDGANNLEVSLRATDDYQGDLSKVVGLISKELSCSAGGHPKASGIRIRKDQLEDLLKKLSLYLFEKIPA